MENRCGTLRTNSSMVRTLTMAMMIMMLMTMVIPTRKNSAYYTRIQVAIVTYNHTNIKLLEYFIVLKEFHSNALI